MFLFSNIKSGKSFNIFNRISALCVLALLSPVACVNPSPTGIYRYDETTSPMTSKAQSPTSAESELSPPPPLVAVRMDYIENPFA